MTPCARCGRPLADSLPRCVYCGAEAPRDRAPEPAATPAPEGPAPGRTLVLLQLDGVDPAGLARALALAPVEAAQRARRAGWQLLRIADPPEAEREAARLAADGLRCVLVPETDARAAALPAIALGGARKGRDLVLRTGEGEVRVETSQLVLVVQGPITREYQTSQQVRRMRMATLEGGFRFHLHRHPHHDPRPLELDPWAFDFGLASEGASSLLQLSGWVRELSEGVAVDETFRRLPPELGVAEAGAAGLLSAADALAARPGGRNEGPLILDNVRQFRFYSGWRAAVERHTRT